MRKKYIVTVLICLTVVGLCLLLQKKQPQQSYTAADFGITRYFSAVDKDGDGVDDQSDIYKAAVSYLATEPKYKSKYYEGGYPDDEYGVCTDVIAFALRDAGYDLRSLVDADIIAVPDAYTEIDKPDHNIDFRRVSNLAVYFERHAIPLTTQLNDIAAWQPGDIVLFSKHIGLVSEKRDENGVPYLWHHANPYQTSYEEPLADVSQKIVGHYRIS